MTKINLKVMDRVAINWLAEDKWVEGVVSRVAPNGVYVKLPGELKEHPYYVREGGARFMRPDSGRNPMANLFAMTPELEAKIQGTKQKLADEKAAKRQAEELASAKWMETRERVNEWKTVIAAAGLRETPLTVKGGPLTVGAMATAGILFGTDSFAEEVSVTGRVTMEILHGETSYRETMTPDTAIFLAEMLMQAAQKAQALKLELPKPVTAPELAPVTTLELSTPVETASTPAETAVPVTIPELSTPAETAPEISTPATTMEWTVVETSTPDTPGADEGELIAVELATQEVAA